MSIDIPAKIIKSIANCYCEKLKDLFNKCLQKKKFPDLMKKPEIIPVYNKKNLLSFKTAPLSVCIKLFKWTNFHVDKIS